MKLFVAHVEPQRKWQIHICVEVITKYYTLGYSPPRISGWKKNYNNIYAGFLWNSQMLRQIILRAVWNHKPWKSVKDIPSPNAVAHCHQKTSDMISIPSSFSPVHTNIRCHSLALTLGLDNPLKQIQNYWQLNKKIKFSSPLQKLKGVGGTHIIRPWGFKNYDVEKSENNYK